MNPKLRNGDDLVTSYTYTPSGGVLPAGMVTSETDPNGNTTFFNYYDTPIDDNGTPYYPNDDLHLEFGYLKEIVLPSVGGQVSTISYAYDISESGTVVTMTDELDRQTRNHYDALERLVMVEQTHPDPTDSSLITTAVYRYDANGNVKEYVDAESNSTTYDYDKNDRLTRVNEADPDPTNPHVSGPVTKYSYDAAGNHTATVDPLNRTTSYQFDPANRLIAVVEPDVDGIIEYPHSNPVNQFDVNADGYVDQRDLDLVLNASGFPVIGESGIPDLYMDANRDGIFNSEDVSAVQHAMPSSGAGSIDYADEAGMPITLYEYDPSGNITAETDQDGNRTEFFYDIRSRLVKIVAPEVLNESGQPESPITRYVYDAASQLTGLIDANSHETNWYYDDAGRLLAEVLPDVDGVISVWQNARNPFDVDLNGKITSADRDALSNALIDGSVSNPDYTFTGSPTDYFPELYLDVNGDGLFTDGDEAAWDSYAHPAPGVVPSLTDNMLLGRPLMQYGYDKSSNLRFEIDAMYTVTEHHYDERNRRTFTIGEDPEKLSQLFVSADPTSQAVRDVRPVTEFSYDEVNRQTFQYDYANSSIGRETEFRYDDLDRVISHLLPDPDLQNGTSFDRPSIIYQYDLVGNLIVESGSEGQVNTYDYDELYRRRFVTSAPVETKRTDPLTTAADDVAVTEWRYDAAGQVTDMINPLGYRTQYSYDGIGRVDVIDYPDPYTGQPTGSLHPMVDYSYSLGGNLLSEVDAMNQTTSWQYDALDRAVLETDSIAAGMTAVTLFAYDLVGNRTKLIDPNLNETSWTFDGVDRGATSHRQIDGASQTQVFGYDLVGNHRNSTDRRGWTINYEFDNLYRNTIESWHDSGGTQLKELEFGYDLAGRMAIARDNTDADFSYSYVYDDLHRAEATYLDIGDLPVDHWSNGFTYDVAYVAEYDASSRLEGLTGIVADIHDFKNNYTYDKLNRLTEVEQLPIQAPGGQPLGYKHVEFNYDLAGQFAWTIRSGESGGIIDPVATTRHMFDNAGRVLVTDHYRDATISEYSRINGSVTQWDPANRLTSTIFTHALYSHENRSYEYNDRSELIGTYEMLPNGGQGSVAESYVYDENGNRQSANGLAYAPVGDHNQLVADGVFSYTYDEAGNRQTQTPKNPVGQEHREFQWDHRQRLTKITDFDEVGSVRQTVDYTYDWMNQLIARTVHDLEHDYQSERYFAHYDGQIVHQFDGFDDTTTSTVEAEAHLTHRYLWGPGVDQLLADDRDGRILWALGDHLGTIRDIVEHDSFTSETTLLKHRQYDAFGNILTEYNRGDFDNDGEYTVADVDLLFAVMQTQGSSGVNMSVLDLNDDGVLDPTDIEILVTQIYGTALGDFDLDGQVGGSDYTILASHFGQTSGALWSDGDTNGDGNVGGPDFSTLVSNFGFNNGQGHIITTEFLFGFTGRMYDIEVGLQNNLHRWYDATVGAWISQDPIGFAAGDANLYGYVGNGPTRWVDATGLSASDGFWSGYWHYLTNPDEMDSDLRNIDKWAKTIAVEAGSTAAGLRGAAALSKLRGFQWLNKNRYCRIGPGKMGGPGKNPRISIGPNHPNNPDWWQDLRHIDLRFRGK